MCFETTPPANGSMPYTCLALRWCCVTWSVRPGRPSLGEQQSRTYRVKAGHSLDWLWGPPQTAPIGTWDRAQPAVWFSSHSLTSSLFSFFFCLLPSGILRPIYDAGHLFRHGVATAWSIVGKETPMETIIHEVAHARVGHGKGKQDMGWLVARPAISVKPTWRQKEC